MLHLLDDSLDAFLRAVGPLPASDVDVSFEPPDGNWAAGLTLPTVNLYLWRLRRSVSEVAAGTELTERDGISYRRGPRPRVQVGYLVTAWATDARNAHQLLGRVLSAFLSTNELPLEYLQGPLAAAEPLPTLSLSKADDDPPAEFWVALGGPFHPGVELAVTATIDPEVMVPVGPPPTVVDLTSRQGTGPDGSPPPEQRARVRSWSRYDPGGGASRVVGRFDDNDGKDARPERREGPPAERGPQQD